MERSGPTPPGGIRPDDLVALAERPGPFASVWVGRSGTGSWGQQADDLRSSDVASTLAGQGAPDAAVAAVTDALAAVSAGAHGAVVVADEHGAVLVEELPAPPRRDRATWAPLPSLTPVIEHRQADVPVVVVLADRAGADIVVNEPGGRSVTVGVEGDDHPIRKSAPGGWSQRRYQQRAEDSWEHNAGDVVEALQELVGQSTPELLVIGGDERAVELIHAALPHDLQAVARTITAGRAADGSEEHRQHDIDRLVRTVVAEDTVALLEAFQQEDGREARATNGAAATLQALQRSQVDVLLVHDDADDERTAWFTTEPGIVAVDRAELDGLGAGEPTAGRLVDVAVAAALRTGAAVRVVPDAAAVHEGIAAILRWSDGPAGAA